MKPIKKIIKQTELSEVLLLAESRDIKFFKSLYILFHILFMVGIIAALLYFLA